MSKVQDSDSGSGYEGSSDDESDSYKNGGLENFIASEDSDEEYSRKSKKNKKKREKRKKSTASFLLDDIASEDEDEEDEEFEEEYLQSKSKRGKKKGKGNLRRSKRSVTLQDDEALEGDFDEENDEDFDPYQRGDEKRKRRGEGAGSSSMLRESQRTTAFDSYINRLENKNEDELKEEYESRFGNYMKEARDERIRSSQSSHYMGSGRLDKINQRSLLPTVNDPRMWVIKCKPGKEWSIVTELMQKSFNLQDTEKPLLIKSALCLSSLKGYVYVEATRESHVQEAIQGMTFINHFKLALVPIEEMVTVVTVKQKTTVIKKGNWVRIKRGLYKGDLAQVVVPDINGTHVKVKLIPRIDLSKLTDNDLNSKSKENTVTSDEFGGNQQSNEDNNNNSGGRKRKKRQGRPQQKAFDANEILSLNGIVESKLDGYDEYHIWNGNWFKDGYLYKKMSIKSVSLADVKPRIEEIEQFRAILQENNKNKKKRRQRRRQKRQRAKDSNGNYLDDDLENLSGDEDSLSDDSMDEDDDNYDKEDEGNLRGIRRLSGGSGKNKEETDPIKMLGPLLGNRQKSFEKGDKIRVIEGDLRNLLGTVEYVEDENVFIKPDHKLLTDLLPVPISQLSKHFDLGTQIKVIDGARKGETGIILAIDGEYAIFFSDSSDEEVKVFINDIQITKQISSGTDTLGQYSMFDLVDLDAQTVGVITKVETDSFKVMDNLGNVRSIKLAEMGQKRNRRGGICVDMANQPIHTNDTVKIVEQRYRGRQARVKHIYRSFVFLHARDILENNGIIVTRSKNVQLVGGLKTREIELLQKQPLPLTMRSRFGKGTRRRKGRNRDEWIGKSVIIQKGPKKGYAGIVIDANELKLRIELHTNAKVINVPRSNVIEPETKTSYGSGYSYTDSNTAYTDSKTPIWDVKTPIHDGSSTPFYDGSMTPMRGFDTPMTGPTPISTPLNSSTGNTLSGMSMNMSGTGQTSTNSGIKSTPRSEDIWNTTQNSSIQIPESPWQTTTTNVSQNLSFTPVNDYPQTPQTSTPNQTFGGTNLSSNQSQVFEPSTPSVNTPKSGTTPFYENHPTTTTPYTQGFTPSTPMTPFVQNTNQSWLTPGIEVKVNTNEGQAQIGIIRSVLSDGNCQIFLTDRNEMVSVQGNNLQPQVPQKNDKIRVIDGLMKGKVGNLMQIDQSQGIVQIDSEFKIIELSYLAKLVD
eukprot:Anaeramoba_flamelloidesa325274_259.p1 GENE.a325274_259~~a325274_259.p1  ORF type:complete len:1208 (-),score=352.74 a325274_259:52-3645(-)